MANEYLYGAYGHIGETVAQSAVQAGTTPVYIGTAPVNLVRGFGKAGIINAPIKITSLVDAQKKIGYSSDWGTFTLCEAVYAHFNNTLGNIGPIYVINVLDPSAGKHRKEAATTKALTFTGGRAEFASDKIILDTLTIAKNDSGNYVEGTDYSVEVPTSAVSNGTKFNGYAAGTITTLVDLIPYIESVTNLTETAGGDDGEPYTTDGDNRLRERIRLAPAKRSTAGPEQAYIYWVMTADSSIVDAKAVSEKETVSETLTVYDGKAFKGGGTLLTDTLVVKAHGQSTAAVKDTDYTVDYADGLLAITLNGSLAAAESIDIIITRTLEGCVKIVPLLEGGGIPDAAMLAKVLDVVNAKDIRPLTDKVSAVPPEVETYDIEIVYYTTPESEAEVIANVEGTGGAIDRYNEWQVAALGRDINPDQLRKRILSPSWGENLTGAFRVDVVKPTYKALDDTQVAKFSGHLTVSHKVESEVV